MTTRIIIAYLDLFTAAIINYPALDVSDDRGGTTPTDDELASIKDSKTTIWLVQTEVDTILQTADCSVCLFGALTGVNVLAKEVFNLQQVNKNYTLILLHMKLMMVNIK